MNRLYRIVWKREVWFSGEIVINDQTDPRIYVDAHARDGELAMRCHKHIHLDREKEEVVILKELDGDKKQWI